MGRFGGSSQQSGSSTRGRCGSPQQSRSNTRGDNFRTLLGAPSGVCSILQNLLTKQEIILDQLRTIILTLQGTGGLRHTTDVDVLEPETLPLHNLESLLDLEARLRSGSDLKQKLFLSDGSPKMDRGSQPWSPRAAALLVFQLSVIKRYLKTPWDRIRKISGKAAFHRMVLKDVITSAVRQNRLTSTASNMEVEVAIKRWLHLASDRDGGRKARDGRAGVAAHSHQF
uniref:uncharacterized protein LOC109951145 n=1 Tax=Monopterus albus TaxID=43700 RepID=UPI0009B31563|nr:uncharacterized protein LOC109951145 [Monopterus albus]